MGRHQRLPIGGRSSPIRRTIMNKLDPRKQLFRDEFEEKLPELLQKAEETLREAFEEDTLPKLLEKSKEQLREQFEEESLPALLEKAEEFMRETFENELPERLEDAVA
jgi:hypothetical protein